jgi:ATP-dependent Clp protease ATP-binding subunit ClpC
MSESAAPVRTPRYASVLGASEEVAREMSHRHVGVEHLFLAILHDKHAVPTQVLGQMIDLDAVEAALIALMNSHGYQAGRTKTVRPPAGG